MDDEGTSIDQLDDNFISGEVDNGHVSSNMDAIISIDEEHINILLSKPKDDTSLETDIIEPSKIFETIKSEVPDGGEFTEYFLQDDNLFKCNFCEINCIN